MIAAVAHELGDRPFKRVAEALGLDPSQATRIFKMERSLSLGEIVTLEKFFGLPPGGLFLSAGLALTATDVPTAVAADPLLTQQNREVVMDAYESAVRRSISEAASKVRARSDRAAKRSPTTPKTRAH